MLFHIAGKVKRWHAFFTFVHFAFGMRNPSLPWCTSLVACAGQVVTLAAPPTVRLLSQWLLVNPLAMNWWRRQQMWWDFPSAALA